MLASLLTYAAASSAGLRQQASTVIQAARNCHTVMLDGCHAWLVWHNRLKLLLSITPFVPPPQTPCTHLLAPPPPSPPSTHMHPPSHPSHSPHPSLTPHPTSSTPTLHVQVTRVQLACASYKFAWHTRPDPQELAPREMREGSLTLADVRWLRAQWLLARTLCAALFHVGDSVYSINRVGRSGFAAYRGFHKGGVCGRGSVQHSST